MRLIVWTDGMGWKRRSLVKDDDPDDYAPHGIPQDIPDINDIDWDGVKRDLHNRLVELDMYDYNDLVKQQTGVTSAVLSALRARVTELYKQRRAKRK
jgi:hypothetical protein